MVISIWTSIAMWWTVVGTILSRRASPVGGGVLGSDLALLVVQLPLGGRMGEVMVEGVVDLLVLQVSFSMFYSNFYVKSAPSTTYLSWKSRVE